MIIDIITIFPEMFSGIINSSIIKRAIEKDVVTINIHDFREYSNNKHLKVDDTVYGGGAGMLISVEPVANCLKSIKGYQDAHKIITSPCGYKYDQKKAYSLSEEKHLIIICGHYEGIDERILNYVDEEISIGDYILTGGEIAALSIIDSVIRLLPGAITKESIEIESFTQKLLEYPQYTKPYEYDNYQVPEILISGNHEEIRKFNKFESVKKTYYKRSDLLNQSLDVEEMFFLEEIKKGINDYNLIDYKKFKEFKSKYNKKNIAIISKM